MYRRGGAAVFAFVGVSLAPCLAAYAHDASGTSIPIHVTARLLDECPSEPSVFERIRGRLGRVIAVPSEDRNVFDVSVDVTREGAIVEGVLVVALGEKRTVRRVRASSCDEALSALAMMAAIALDADADAAPTAPLPAPPPTAAPPAPPPPARPRPPPVKRNAPSRAAPFFGASLEVHGLGSAVVVPSLFVGLSFPGTLHPSLRLAIARSVGAELAIPSGSAAFAWLYATVRECVEIRRGPVAFGPCASASAGTLDVHTLPPTQPASLQRLWLTIGAGARLEWRVARAISLELAAGFASPVRRHELYFEPQATIYRTPLFMPFGAARVVFRIP